LTGGIASGKTTVGEMLVRLGAKLIQADAIAHQLMQPGEAVYEEVVRRFGEAILNADRTISRAKLAEAVFGASASPCRIKQLNGIVHPEVIRRQEQWMEEVGRQRADVVAVVEAALILEAGVAQRFDRLVVVTCHFEQRIERWARRLHTDLESARREVTRRMAKQMPDDRKIQVADQVIDNSGSLENTERQVRAAYSTLAEAAVKQMTDAALAGQKNKKAKHES